MQKASKPQADYREGNPMRSCGLCGNYTNHKCKVVFGDISPYGFCDYYKRQDNPFRKGIQYNYSGPSSG
jgi:hypothetical protein